MAAITEYPISGSPIIRGDPLTIPLTIKVNGIEQDVSTWAWRAHIRRSPDSDLITEFAIEATTPEGGTVPSQLLLSLDSAQTTILKTGYVFDLEQLVDLATPVTARTWWICTKITVQKDVSHD